MRLTYWLPWIVGGILCTVYRGWGFLLSIIIEIPLVMLCIYIDDKMDGSWNLRKEANERVVKDVRKEQLDRKSIPAGIQSRRKQRA